jgi:two-component system, cell cycle response regulator
MDTSRGGVLEAVWLLVALSLGGAGLHPSMRTLTERSDRPAPDTSSARLVLLALVSTCAPALLLVEHLRGAYPDVVAASLACMALFPLTLARMAAMVAAQRRMATTDSVTELGNRRFFDEQLSRLVTRARHRDGRLGVLLLDLDHFKQINDTYGHDVGDRVLARISRALRDCVRPGDTIARYGGEEFAAGLPGLHGTALIEVAERIRREVAAATVTGSNGLTVAVTVSIGAACLPEDGLTPDGLLRAADMALYEAKRGGRDRTVYHRSLDQALARA